MNIFRNYSIIFYAVYISSKVCRTPEINVISRESGSLDDVKNFLGMKEGLRSSKSDKVEEKLLFVS